MVTATEALKKICIATEDLNYKRGIKCTSEIIWRATNEFQGRLPGCAISLALPGKKDDFFGYQLLGEVFDGLQLLMLVRDRYGAADTVVSMLTEIIRGLAFDAGATAISKGPSLRF